MTPSLQDFCRDERNLAYARRLIDGACELRRLDREMRAKAKQTKKDPK